MLLVSTTWTVTSVSPNGNPINGETMLQNCLLPLGRPPGVNTDWFPFWLRVQGELGRKGL